MTQDGNDDRRHLARRTDPEFSHEAARSTNIGQSSVRLLNWLRQQTEPKTHEQMQEALAPLAESGIRTRCNELQGQGLVRQVSGSGRTKRGRRAGLYEAVPPQEQGPRPPTSGSAPASGQGPGGPEASTPVPWQQQAFSAPPPSSSGPEDAPRPAQATRHFIEGQPREGVRAYWAQDWVQKDSAD